MQLPECRVLLTGATGGIGRELALRLCAGGARVLLVGRQAPRLEALLSGVPRAGRGGLRRHRQPRGPRAGGAGRAALSAGSIC